MTEESKERLSVQQYITELESQLADTTRQHNEEIRGVANEVACLQSQLEQNETERQSLHFQLTLAQRDSRQSNAILAEKEGQWNSMQATLRDEILKLSQQCEEWRSTLDTVQEARAQDRMHSQQLLASKENQLSVKSFQCEDLITVKQQLEHDLEEKKRVIHEQDLKLQLVEEELKTKNITIERQSHELEDRAEEERKQDREIQNMLDKITTLESHLEMERASLQDAKFANDMSQLRLKEVEGTLKKERGNGKQLSDKVGELKQTVSSLRCALEEEERRASVLGEQLQSKEDAYVLLEQQSLQQQAVVSDLSHQVQLHQSNLHTLREELNLTKQRWSVMKDEYGGCVREVDSLIDQFRVRIISKDKENTTTTKNSGPGSCHSHVPEKLRVTLIEFKALYEAAKVQLGTTKSQLSNVRQNLKQLSSECSTYREIVTARTGAMADADKQLGESALEISRLSKELTVCKAKASSLKKELDTLQQNYDEEKKNHQNNQEKLDTLRQAHRSDTEEHCRFLCLLHEQLRMTVNSIPNGFTESELESNQSWPSTSTPLKKPMPADFTNLSTAVSTAALTLCETLKRSKREVKSLKLTVSNLKSTLESTRTMHKETTCKLTLNHEEQESQWNQRNEQMKANFESLLVEAENKALNLQQRLDDALRDVTQLGESKQQLETRLKQLQEIHRVYKNDRACLLSCTCLLAGSLFPALQRLQQLQLQKAILLKQVLESQKLHKSAVEVVTSIQDHIGVHTHVVSNGEHSHREGQVPNNERTQPHALLSLLKFRKAVIVVLAVRRLQVIHSQNNILFKVNYPRNVGQFQIPVHLGHRAKRTSNESSPTMGSSPPPPSPQAYTLPAIHHRVPKPSSKELAGWMRSEKALVEVRESFTHLQSLLDSCTTQMQKQQQPLNRGQASKKEKSLNASHRNMILRPAKTAFEALLEKMGGHFPHMKDSSSSFVIYSDGLCCLQLHPKSLCYQLAQGLFAILGKKPHHPQHYTKSSELGKRLHCQVINLVGRLHQGEIQQHSLHSQLLQSKSHSQRLSRELQTAGELKERVESLQAELGMMIPRGQFETICKDFEASLKREKELKIYLSQHVSVVEQLQTKLQLAYQEMQCKETTLSKSSKELHELRLSLKHKEHQLSAVSKQLELMDREKVAQAQQLGELQTALAMCRKQMVNEMMSDSQVRDSTSQPQASGNSFVPL